MVFADQDVAEDPPFSRVDLISCRNLLIYMGSDLQKKVLSVFSYALNPGGFLFLGTSGTIGEFTDFFVPINRKWKIFLRKPGVLAQRSGCGDQLWQSCRCAGLTWPPRWARQPIAGKGRPSQPSSTTPARSSHTGSSSCNQGRRNRLHSRTDRSIPEPRAR